MDADRLTVTDCDIYGNPGGGVYVGINSDQALLRDNLLHGNGFGAYVFFTLGSTVADNTFYQNATGLCLVSNSGTAPTTISGNHFYANTPACRSAATASCWSRTTGCTTRAAPASRPSGNVLVTENTLYEHYATVSAARR